ncbi:MAG TPA: TetR/AcrR family transcriptional regulator [Solirubrobacterales bacterium]
MGGGEPGNRRDEERRGRVHRALIELCFERGFAAVTAKELCGRAGVDREFFEREYGDLKACFLRGFEVELQRFHDRLDPIRNSDAPWRERVWRTGYELLRLFKEDEKATHFLVVEVRTAGEQALLLFGAEINAMVDLIDEGRGVTAHPEEVTRATAEQITGGFFNHLYALFSQGDLPPEEEIIPQLMYTAVLPYLGEEAAVRELSAPPPPDPQR